MSALLAVNRCFNSTTTMGDAPIILRGGVVRDGKVDVEKADELGVREDDARDGFTRECFLRTRVE
jgi:hypothetical protein